ncbi:MAG: DUF2190 domain-containing protein [Candidatus Riflebacteria bacterium HGW-Riflebacteria-2]|jgi:hypothetical protein|nr:MAG: DUF2190 domain-containing protein [Candidatus Riflebacteria bacterium HGW-Riflebacteria-2]
MRPLIKNYVAEDATEQYLIAKQGTADYQSLKSGAAATNSLGVVCQPGEVAIGDRMDVVILGEAEVLCAGNINAGKSFTADADGKAVAANATERAVGIVLEAGAATRIVRCLVVPHTA